MTTDNEGASESTFPNKKANMGRAASHHERSDAYGSIVDTASLHLASSSLRQVRIRKTVERLEAKIDVKSVKPVVTPPGMGTPLKDIPSS